MWLGQRHGAGVAAIQHRRQKPLFLLITAEMLNHVRRRAGQKLYDEVAILAA